MTAGPNRTPAIPRADDVVPALARGGPALVALSGGVDSAVVAWLARRALGRDSIAVTLAGPSVARAEIRSAVAVAREIDIRHRVVTVDPLQTPEYRANPANRCYFCRSAEARVFLSLGAQFGVRQFLDGVHVDDLGDDRPGLRAMNEAGFCHPLLDAGWTKSDVRAFAHSIALTVADRPSNACLASRVRQGVPLTASLLALVEAAEDVVASYGFRRVRVRVDGKRARVVVGADEARGLCSEPVASQVRARLGALGLNPVDLDPVGYTPRAGM